METRAGRGSPDYVTATELSAGVVVVVLEGCHTTLGQLKGECA
jgi:hypothetical protein